MNRNPPWLASLLDEHFEEIQMLWEMRGSAIRDAALTESAIVELDDRIEAHIDGLIIAAEKAWPMLLAGLTGERLTAFAAAMVLLRQGPAGSEKVLTVIEKAEGPALAGICEALCHSGIDDFAVQLKAFYQSGSAPLAAALAEVFAFHGRFQAGSKRLPELLVDVDPVVSQTAWRIVALVDD